MEPTTPVPGTFVYVAWKIDLRLRGPFVRSSAERQRFITDLRTMADTLRGSAGIARVRCLESTFIAPVAQHPRFDVAMLADGNDGVSSAVGDVLRASGAPTPTLMCTAANTIRYGDTDSLGGPILLNHFAASSSPQKVADTWEEISRWYGSVLGVTNSTLLEFTDGAPYAVMNYASIPGPVVRFMLDQLLRPSFYRNVTARLNSVGARPLPVFARRIG